jgi:thiol-disulfide isomerase/thioredoxin
MMVSEASRNPSRPWWALGIALVLIALSLLVRRPWQERAATDGYGLVDQPVSESGAGSLPVEPAPGKLAPNFRLRTSDGEEIVLADLRGRPVLVNFWATWCLFCVTEMPALDEFARRHQGRVTVIGINVGEPPETVEAFARQVGVHYPLLLDTTRELVD